MGDGLSQDNAMGATMNGQDHDSLEDGEVDVQEQQPALHTTESHEHAASLPWDIGGLHWQTGQANASPQLHEQQQQPFDAASNGATQENISMPQAVIGGGNTCRDAFLSAESCANTLLVHDQALKDLMMSWYFAGYYTGLYEGKQQATQAMTGEGSVNQHGRWWELFFGLIDAWMGQS